MIGAGEVRDTASDCEAYLRAHLHLDWSAPVPDLEMTVVEVVAHAATGCLWYAIDLAAGGKDLEPVEFRVKTAGAPIDVLDTFVAHAEVLASVIQVAPAAARGFHPMGAADPSGFAAMACDEMLIHTYDVSLSLEVPFAPDVAVVEGVLERLFPWVEAETSLSEAIPISAAITSSTAMPNSGMPSSGMVSNSDSWQQLLWANGRVKHGDLSRLSDWAWHCAPTSEWDGSTPNRP